MSDGYDQYDHFDGIPPEELSVLYERHRADLPRSHGGFGSKRLHEYESKACTDCGAEFTAARALDTCLRCT